MIHFDSVTFSYGERRVLTDITLDLNEHRIGVVGGNGSGKSTFARLINGLLAPISGAVIVDGLNTVHDLKKVRTKVGFVFQDPDLQIVMPTVAEDLAFSLRPLRLPKSEVESQVSTWLDAYGLADHRDHPAHLLSGGQKQLLAIAAILIMKPQIVVFDEPTTLLDLRNKRRIMNVVDSLEQQAIVVTHDLEFLNGFDRVLVLDQGRVVADDSPAPALDAYKRLSREERSSLRDRGD
ncbi:MAG: energy-coupling factor ABC transporter ATP-binding protein [Propionibacteriaceae bacterium]|jgi:biotin transport system ATP-binding protein|nr:energy-coupling factor ABC transporter ATP-binding protein [Propionibacteriaceae bacterium]